MATLPLRAVGRGEVQARAFRELEALPENHPLRRNLLRIATTWFTLLQARPPTTSEDRELFMNLQVTFEEFQDEARKKGLEMGLEKGLEKGKLIGKILAMREVLEQAPPEGEDLDEQSLEALEATLLELRNRLHA